MIFADSTTKITKQGKEQVTCELKLDSTKAKMLSAKAKTLSSKPNEVSAQANLVTRKQIRFADQGDFGFD
jgi:hypothetical protein